MDLPVILAVLLLSAFLVVFCWPGMPRWLKKGLLCLTVGMGLVCLGIFAPRKVLPEDSSYLETTTRGGRTLSTGIKSGAELNKDERRGAHFAMAMGGLLLLGGVVVLVRRK